MLQPVLEVNNFLQLKFLPYKAWTRTLFIKVACFTSQAVAKNRILSNCNKLIYIFYNVAITNFKLVMLPSDSPPQKTWVKIPYLSSLAVRLPSYAEKYDFNNGGSSFEYFVMS